jgi:hypothetical protein
MTWALWNRLATYVGSGMQRSITARPTMELPLQVKNICQEVARGGSPPPEDRVQEYHAEGAFDRDVHHSEEKVPGICDVPQITRHQVNNLPDEIVRAASGTLPFIRRGGRAALRSFRITGVCPSPNAQRVLKNKLGKYAFNLHYHVRLASHQPGYISKRSQDEYSLQRRFGTEKLWLRCRAQRKATVSRTTALQPILDLPSRDNYESNELTRRDNSNLPYLRRFFTASGETNPAQT